MRITHVITRLIAGGAQENTIASVLGLALRGFAAELISGPGGGPEGSLEGKFANFPGLLSIMPELVRPLDPWKDALAFRKLIHGFRERRPDIVHTHSGKAGILGRLAAHRVGVPIIVHTIHGPSFGAFQGPFSNALFGSAERWAGRVTTHFVAVANAMREQYLAAGIGGPGRYTIIHSGFDLNPYLHVRRDESLRHDLGFAPNDVVVGKIGRLFKLKGHDDLFAAARRLATSHPQLKFLLVGDGEWRARFEQMAAHPPFRGRFSFTGLVPPERIPVLLGAVDILAHLSKREGLARALPQALAAGRPVVAYDCDGAREVCLDGETGWLVRAGDIGELAERLADLAKNPTLRKEMGARGRELVKASFSEEVMVDSLVRLYQKLGGEKPLRSRVSASS